ncbi:MAG TPA: hypothetical protein PK231_04450 [Acidocella sp.]|jgi:hypothetical protein|nr:MAG: hypothetical protein B7Z77_02645 [Acidocella sp. 20-58-15]HQT38653.1 hypothetical protein [Acidocella sp.]
MMRRFFKISAIVSAVIIASIAARATPAAASQPSLVCSFYTGPLIGQMLSYGMTHGTPAFAIGAPCADGNGSYGVTVAASTIPLVPGTSLTCQYTTGRKAGLTQSFVGIPNMQPLPVGAPCTDRVGDYGITIADFFSTTPMTGVKPLNDNPAIPVFSGAGLACHYLVGDRAGQTQSFAHLPGVSPLPPGTPCTDGMGSGGITE